MKDSFCTAFVIVSEYLYCLTVRNTVPYSYLFGVSFAKFGVGWKFLFVVLYSYVACSEYAIFKLLYLIPFQAHTSFPAQWGTRTQCKTVLNIFSVLTKWLPVCKRKGWVREGT